MRLLLWVANTSMTSREYLVALSLSVRSIELDLHKLIHVLHSHHVAVQLNNPVVLLQGERSELAPAVVEARVIGKIFVDGGKKILDSLLAYPADLKSAVTFRGKGVGIESNERVFGAMLFKRVVKCEKA